MKQILVIFVCSIFYGNQIIEAFECKEKDGLFPDPGNKHGYYNCVNWLPTHDMCPHDDVFDVTKKECGDKNNPNVVTSPAPETFKCPEKFGYYVDPKNKHKFYECRDDMVYHMDCPDNLVFNTKIERCDYDNEVTDAPTTPPTTPTTTTTTTTTPTTTTPTTTTTRSPTTKIATHIITEALTTASTRIPTTRVVTEIITEKS